MEGKDKPTSRQISNKGGSLVSTLHWKEAERERERNLIQTTKEKGEKSSPQTKRMGGGGGGGGG